MFPSNKTYISEIGGYEVKVVKQYRTKSQYEYILSVFYKGTDMETVHLITKCHLTLKSAFMNAKKAIISNPPRIERVF